jgi:hypothetical protein
LNYESGFRAHDKQASGDALKMTDAFARARAIRERADNAWRRADTNYDTNATTDEVTTWAAAGGASKAPENARVTGQSKAQRAGEMLARTAHLPDDHPDKVAARKAWDERNDSSGASVHVLERKDERFTSDAAKQEMNESYARWRAKNCPGAGCP